jgi:prevent-host-death family protein
MGVEVGVRELRDHLSQWLERVKAGGEVIVTERGMPVARLTSVKIHPEYQRLIDEGIIHPARRPKSKALPPLKTKSGVNISDYVRKWR